MPVSDREQQNAWSRASYRRNRERALGQKRAWREANPDYMRRYAQEHRAEKRASRYRATYRITQDDYDQLLALQDGHCAICEATIGMFRGGQAQPLFVDHDQESGAVRGLLCNRCNSAIAYFDHSVERTEAAARYLTSPPAQAWFGKDEEG